jgi:hypothetical protein
VLAGTVRFDDYLPKKGGLYVLAVLVASALSSEPARRSSYS